ncbi:MAG: hypothetical protein AB1724_12460 [Thermodesulfobacteriota bacterium]
MKNSIYRAVVLGILLMAVGLTGVDRVAAMQALSTTDMGGVTGMAGLTIYFKDLDATLIQLDDYMLDLSPSDTTDCSFRIRDDNNRTSMPLPPAGLDGNNIAMSFCGSPTDESVPINVDFLGLEIDIGYGRCAGETILDADAITFSLTGYGSTEMYNVWDLAQFDPPTAAPFDVFGLTLGEIFWAEKYIDPEKHLFMHILLSPLSSYADAGFVDSNEGAWQVPIGTGLTKAQIRDNTGVGGELGLKPGGGTFGFTGFKKSTGSPQRATISSVMLAGKIIDQGTTAAGPYASADTDQYPNWKSINRNYYYQDSLNNWNIMGEAVIGVHHYRTYNRTNYIGKYASGANFDMSTFADNVIGATSPTRPLRFQVATADAGYDCDGDGLRDTYLISYMNGHYSRTVYFPDSAVSSMGASPSTSPTSTVPRKKEYILGDMRIGFSEERYPSRDWSNGVFTTLIINGSEIRHGGSWVVNDISLEYNKVVIPGDRNLVQETSAASEDYIIPDRDYGNDGTNNVNQLVFLGDPTSSARTMEIANPCDGDAGGNYGLPMNEGDTAADLSRPSTWWR